MAATISALPNRERRTSVRSHDSPRTYRLQPVVVQFDWFGNAPDAAVPADFFAVVATADVELDQGEYIVQTFADDGIRVSVDEQVVIDNWKLHGATLDTATVDLAAGRHNLRIEFFELTGTAVLKFSMRRRNGDER